MSVKVVNSGSGVINITAETIPTIKVSSSTVSVVDINPVVTGSTIGPTGAQGPAGSDGQGLEAGGDKHQVLKKTDDVDYNTEWGFADRVFISVKFDEAVSAGDPVYVSGYQSGQDVVKVSKADSSDSAKMPAIGLAIEDYSLNAFGSVACIGSLYGIDTDDFNVGDVLYVKSGGGLTKDKPTGATNLIQNVGKVGRSQQNTGEIVVMAIGRSNDVPNIADGKIWIGNGSGVATPTTLNAAAIPDFDTEVSNNSSVAANTAKETNVTTDLGLSRSSVNVTVISSDGTNATIPQVSTSLAGVMTAAEHVKLANLNASADVTNSSSVAAAGAVMDTDFAQNGLMRRTGSGQYDTVAASTTNIAEGTNQYYTDAKVNTLLGNTNVSALANGNSVILTTTADVSGTSFVLGENNLAANSTTKVPTQASVKAYVDSQLSPAIQMDSGSPAYNSQTNEAEIRTLLNLENSDIRGLVSASTSGSGSLSYDSGNGVFTYAGPNLSTYVQQSDLSATGSVSGIALSENNGAFTLGGSLNTIPVDGGGTGATTVAGAKQNLDLEDADIRGKFSAGANISISSEGVIATTGVLTSESNDLSASVTWSNVPDANITSSSVTQHLSTSGNAVGGINISESNGVFSLTGSLDITADAAPVLGGDLDVGGNTITSSSNGNVEIHPDGTGDVIIDGQGVDIRHNGATKLDTTASGIKVVGNINVNDAFTIPNIDGAANQVLQTNGSGTLSWVTLPAADTIQTLTLGTPGAETIDLAISGSGGNTVTIPKSTDTAAGLMTEGQFEKLNGIDDNATNYGDSNVNAHLSGGTGIGYNNGVISVNGTTTFTTADSGGNAVKAVINGPDGNTNDLIFTQGSNVTLTQANGNITIAATSGGIDDVEDDTSPSLGGNLNVNDFHIVSDASEHITIEAGSGGDVNINGEPVNIKHAGTTRLATSGTGVTITGHVDMADDDEIRLGDSDDFTITYDSALNDGVLKATAITFKGSNDEFMLLANEDGAVSLYHDNARRFDTSSYGVNVTGYATALGYTTNLSTALSVVGNHKGATLVEQVYSSGSVTNGKVYYMGSSAWAEGHADTEGSAKGMLAIATSAASSGRFVTKGLVRVLDIKGSTPSKGDIVYLSEDSSESGYVTVDRPSADGDIVRILGYVVDNGNNTIYFDPSPDFIEIA